MMYQPLGVLWQPALERLLASEPHVARYAAHAGAILASASREVLGGIDGTALAGGLIVSFGPFDAEIEALVVAAAWRRQGVGRVLVHQALQRAKALGKARVLLEVRESNTAARALYCAAGFNEDGRRRRYYPPLAVGGAREDACLMSYALQANSPPR